MNCIDYIAMELQVSQGWIMGLVADIKDAPLTAPTPNGGNHPLWILGHLVHSEANLLNVFIKGEENPLAEWQEMFGIGSTPLNDASKYPSIEEVMAKFEEVRAATLAYLKTLTDADLDKPSHAPEEHKDFFGTIGQCFATMNIHFAFHGGQVADARRAAGRDVLMA